MSQPIWHSLTIGMIFGYYLVNNDTNKHDKMDFRNFQQHTRNWKDAVGFILATGFATLVVKGANDGYNKAKAWCKQQAKKIKEAKKLEELKKLRPWDYFRPQQKGVTGSNLQVAHKIPLWGYAIYEGWNYTLFAPTNVGKTALAQQILCELAYADTSAVIPGMEIGKGRRLMFFDEEYDLANLSEEFVKFNREKSKEVGDRIEFYGKTGDVEAFLDRLYSLLKNNPKPAVVFIDNISALCGQNIQKQVRLLNGVKKIKDYLKYSKQPSHIVTTVLIGHTNLQNYTDRYKPITERDMQGSSELGNMITGSIAMGYTRLGPGYYRLLFPKNKAMQATDKVHVIRRADAINFEHICEMNEEDTIVKNASLPENANNTSGVKPLVDPEILKRAEALAKETDEAKAERERLKDGLEKECLYAKMNADEKEEVKARVRELRKAGYSLRQTSCIILLEMNIYISTDGVSKTL